MQRDVKDDLVPNVLLYKPKNDDGASVEYKCDLEKMAGEILADPGKSLTEAVSLKMHPLVFAMYVALPVCSLASRT
ncbi:hypothetical protein Y032_0457g1812 [Ancylostoma ceylanicum]|uniref:Uncharacterized protein n=1 Tax=Ancylostoma ceylanicum TaxID=53326 RepID=A0A016WYD3_9BILA|nr:hypothetical protein Y032_0457g1812 [Ancylostoma ceylanicum]